jgi:hypothetical protein
MEQKYVDRLYQPRAFSNGSKFQCEQNHRLKVDMGKATLIFGGFPDCVSAKSRKLCARPPATDAFQQIMPDDKPHPDDSATGLRSTSEQHEWRYEIQMLQREFPARTARQIEDALRAAFASNGPGVSLREVELSARSSLAVQSLFEPSRG